MKNSKKIAALLLVLVLMTTCFVGGTFAKYISSTTSEDAARVAYWGWQPVQMDITGLFDKAYIGGEAESHTAQTAPNNDNSTVWSQGTNGGLVDVIAPGTTNSATFAFKYEVNGDIDAPEVDYNFTVSTEGSTIADDIKNNPDILWKLDDSVFFGTWDELIADILALSGDASGSCDYTAGTLPNAFTADDDVHTITWLWKYDTEQWGEANDDVDTAMGNKAALDQVKLVITITATQLN